MNKKEKNQLWRMPLFFSLLVTVIYLLIFQKHGALPSGSYFDLLNDLERAQNGLKAFDGIINLPFELSRWFDILFTWLITTYIVRITIWGFADFRKEEPETTVGEKNDDQGFLSIGLMAGTFVGIAASIALSLITSIDGFLMPELILIIIIGLGASMFGKSGTRFFLNIRNECKFFICNIKHK